jgi:hypothetical protein
VDHGSRSQGGRWRIPWHLSCRWNFHSLRNFRTAPQCVSVARQALPNRLNPRCEPHLILPNRRYRPAVTRYLSGSDDPEVQPLLDRTAHAHGPSHREGPEHTIQDLAQQQAFQDRLPPEKLAAAMHYVAVDRASTAAWGFESEPPRKATLNRNPIRVNQSSAARINTGARGGHDSKPFVTIS